ncbi:MAG: gfo/Idh/MocA family oxidoreductase, partial [Planctomycetota bacterium]
TVNTPDRLEIIGTDGRILVDDLNQGDLRWFDAEGEHRESHPPAENLHAPLIADFTSALTENRKPTIDGERGQKTNLWIERLYGH